MNRRSLTGDSNSRWRAWIGAVGLCVVVIGVPFSAAGAAVPVNSFDHLTTGFELTGSHRDAACESCHVNAVFEGTPRECVACHSPGKLVGADPKPSDHIMSSDRCGDCHTTAAFLPASLFNHAEVRGSCQSCHDNVRSTGKPSTHVVTSLDCNACHNTTAWVPAKFDHTGITSNCVSCHDGGRATGKSPTHIASSNSCESCHTPADWSPVMRVDHSQVIGSCTSCHNGSTATVRAPITS